MSRQSRRMMIIDGVRFSFRAKKVENSRRCIQPRDKGLSTKDHIPRSLISQIGGTFPSGEPPPVIQDGDLRLPRGLPETFDLESSKERDSKSSMRSVNAAR